MTLDEFIEKVCQRPLPQNPMARIRTLAKELAEGATESLWGIEFTTTWLNPIDDEYINKYSKSNSFLISYDLQQLSIYLNNQYPTIIDHVPAKEWQSVEEFLVWLKQYRFYYGIPNSNNSLHYLNERWGSTIDVQHYYELLKTNGFFSSNSTIRKEAFDLLEETETSTIFISYRRSESSAFALLVLKSLKQEGLESFLDLALEPGEDWHAGLKERIQSRDYFILLLGNTTLKSPHVIKEIEWALEKGLAIVPIWQPEFEFRAEEWSDLPEPIKHKLSNTHRFKVQDENPLEYEKALIELLNRFGITP